MVCLKQIKQLPVNLGKRKKREIKANVLTEDGRGQREARKKRADSYDQHANRLEDDDFNANPDTEEDGQSTGKSDSAHDDERLEGGGDNDGPVTGDEITFTLNGKRECYVIAKEIEAVIDYIPDEENISL